MNITFDPRNADDRSLVLALLGNLEAPQAASPGQDTTSIHLIKDGKAGPALTPAEIEALRLQQPPAEEKPKRTRRTKEQIAADEAAQKVDPAKADTEIIVKPPAAVDPPAVRAASEATQAPAAGEVKSVGELLANSQTAGQAAPAPTKEELIAKFQALVAKFGKEQATEKARAIISGLGAANVSGIPEDKRAEAVAAVDAELAKV